MNIRNYSSSDVVVS